MCADSSSDTKMYRIMGGILKNKTFYLSCVMCYELAQRANSVEKMIDVGKQYYTINVKKNYSL